MTRNGGSAGKRKHDLSMEGVLNAQPDIQHQKSFLMLSIEARGHMCVMLPKFHCECNGIELAWARSKQYTRANCEYTMPGLRKTVPMSYGEGSMSLEFHRKISRKAGPADQPVRWMPMPARNLSTSRRRGGSIARCSTRPWSPSTTCGVRRRRRRGSVWRLPLPSSPRSQPSRPTRVL